MPRIVGVDVPNDKSIWIALTYITGIGQYLSEQILKEAKI
jgi:small subunit ribosomal protein S13